MIRESAIERSCASSPRESAEVHARSLAIVFLALFFGVTAVPVRAQATDAGTAAHTHAPEDSSSAFLEVIHEPEAERLTIALGPIDLPARTTHHELAQIPVQEGTVPFDFTIRGYRAEVVDGNGDAVPQDVIHHLNLLDPRRRELFLPIMLRVLAASHETSPVRVPGWLFGIPMRGGSPFLALTMLHNPTDTSYEEVSVRLVIEYEASDVLPVYPIVPWHLDTMFPLGRKAFDLPPGRSSKSYEASPAIRGLILGLGGHLHRYATSLRLEDVTTGEVLYEVEPELRPDGHIERIPALLHRGRGIGMLVEPSHVYRVTAEYSNPTGETIPDGGMGSVAGAFLPLEPWPGADPFDPLYRADYEWVLASLRHGEGGGAHEHGGRP